MVGWHRAATRPVREHRPPTDGRHRARRARPRAVRPAAPALVAVAALLIGGSAVAEPVAPSATVRTEIVRTGLAPSDRTEPRRAVRVSRSETTVQPAAASPTPLPTPTASGSPTADASPPEEPAAAPPAEPAPAPEPAPSPAPPSSTSGGGAGVPSGVSLTVHEGDLTITTPGTVIDSLDIHGYLRIKAANVTVRNSVVRGGRGLAGPMALVQSSSPGVQIIDSELVAAEPSYWIDGIVGSGFTLTRVDIHGVVDSVKITGDNVLIQGSLLHDNLYYATVPSGGDTHNDNVQIQRGKNLTIRDSVLTSTRNAALMVTQDAGPVADLTFTGNRADNGACTINIAEKSYGPVRGLTITGNSFGTGTRHDHCAVLAPPSTSSISTISSNSFTDGRPFRVSPGS